MLITLVLSSALGVSSATAVETAGHRVLQQGVTISGVRVREMPLADAPVGSSLRPVGEVGMSGALPNGGLWVGAELRVASAGHIRRFRLEADVVALALKATAPGWVRSVGSTAVGGFHLARELDLLPTSSSGELHHPWDPGWHQPLVPEWRIAVPNWQPVFFEAPLRLTLWRPILLEPEDLTPRVVRTPHAVLVARLGAPKPIARHQAAFRLLRRDLEDWRAWEASVTDAALDALVGVLRRAALDRYATVRMAALRGLERLGPRAQAALPEVARAMVATDINTQCVASAALRAIQPTEYTQAP